jgi:hypothetical protein
MLKAPGTIRLKLKCDILLSTSAFKINLRHYSKGRSSIYINGTLSGEQKEGAQDDNPETTVGRCNFNGLDSCVEKLPDFSA